MVKMVALVERGKGRNNFSCHCPKLFEGNMLAGYGKNAREAMEDIVVSYNECRQFAEEKGETLPEVTFEYKFDVGAFFDYYPLDVSATAKYIGVSPSILRQYVAAFREPKEKQLAKIKEGIEKLSGELMAPALIDEPAAKFVSKHRI